MIGKNYARMDTGIKQAMNNASTFIKSIEDRQSLIISCLEEIAYRRGSIYSKQLKKIAEIFPTEYDQYLKSFTIEFDLIIIFFSCKVIK